jgi:molybdate transport system substrate-binding protein
VPKAACAAAILAAAAALTPAPAGAAEVRVAVAANFAEVLKALAPGFERRTGDRVTAIVGSTGKLYAQIVHGAPFDVMLAADRRRPRLLVANGFAVEGSRFTYAVGRLTLWSPDPKRIAGDGAAILRRGAFRRLAIANPRLAPYGQAAKETLTSLGRWPLPKGRLVQAENIGQAFALVATGNADLGLVALSLVLSPRNGQKGSRWDVPAKLYRPIRQDAVLLRRAAGDAAAKAFLAYLRAPATRGAIARFGYTAPSQP